MGWKDDLFEASKTKAEREEEERIRQAKRVEEALSTADAAMTLALQALEFSAERLRSQKQPVVLEDIAGGKRLKLHEPTLEVALSRETAILTVLAEGNKPREFDFVRDRHIAAADVEEYVGKRCLELVRLVQQNHPW